jgi:enoyl-CoA hydratase
MLLVDRSGPVATVTLNRPEAMNALSRGLRQALRDALVELAADDSVRVIVLTGAGRAFCAGLDLKELGQEEGALGSAVGGDPAANPVAAMDACPKPIIGAINGAAITGGFELALACDVLIGSSNARFADTHARVGIMPGWGLSQKLSRAIGISRAKELSLTGNFLDAATASDWGLINRVVAADDLLAVCQKLALDMATVPEAASQTYKSLIDEGFGLSFKDAMAVEARVSQAHNPGVKADSVAQARLEVTARGRDQTAG